MNFKKYILYKYCINIINNLIYCFLWWCIIINKYFNFYVNEFYDYFGNFGNYCNLYWLKYLWLICVWFFFYLNFDFCFVLNFFFVLLFGKVY